MPRKRKMSTAVSALSHFSLPVPRDHENVSFRKIDNGYIIRHDGIKGGKSFEREFYCNKPPSLNVKKPTKGK